MDQKVSYQAYIKVDELLTLQEELSNPKHHDELLFIIIHQSHELWFKLIVHELKRVYKQIENEIFFEALKSLDRVIVIFKSLIQQFDILHTLSPDEFLGYRDLLNPASGFQSYQNRIVEFLCGIKEKAFLDTFQNKPENYNSLIECLEAPSIWDKVIDMLHRLDFNIPESVRKRNFSEPYQANESVTHAIKEVYLNREKYAGLHYLFEKLIELDTTVQIWRMRHFKNAERVIGRKPGTGGSKGMEYLFSTISKKFFPELWEVRTIL